MQDEILVHLECNYKAVKAHPMSVTVKGKNLLRIAESQLMRKDYRSKTEELLLYSNALVVLGKCLQRLTGTWIHELPQVLGPVDFPAFRLKAATKTHR